MSTFLYAMSRWLRLGARQIKMSPNNVVVITGCDSGLGFAFAVYCHSLNMTVISACHNLNSKGAQLLRSLKEPKRMITIELDLLKQETIQDLEQHVEVLLRENSNYELTALVNNAGTMCFAEFEWQTRHQYEMQINVNLLGTMHLTKEFLPLIRKRKGRIINITSHCGLQALPTLSPYAASKAGLRFWNDALRMEMSQYGVEVVNFVPGSFVTESNITARQKEHANEMWSAMKEEPKEFYGEYFMRFNSYLNCFIGSKPPDCVRDAALLKKFHDALTSTKPKAVYIHEPVRYKFYRLLFYILPIRIVDWLTFQFCAMPTYKSNSDADKKSNM